MVTHLERLEGHKRKREVYLEIEREYGEKIPEKRVLELMKEANIDVPISWISYIRKTLRRERGQVRPYKKNADKQQVLLPKKNAFQTSVALVLRAMKTRHIKKTIICDDGTVQTESVETFSI